MPHIHGSLLLREDGVVRFSLSRRSVTTAAADMLLQHLTTQRDSVERLGHTASTTIETTHGQVTHIERRNGHGVATRLQISGPCPVL